MPFESIWVWGRNLERAQATAEALRGQGLPAQAAQDLDQTLAQADVVAVATTASAPFIAADAVRPGTHLGLVGAFTPRMAEAEPALMARAQLFADHRGAVIEKGGEVWMALQQGLIAPSAIEAELAELVAQPQRAWRHSAQSITVFKSVGFASLDLIAAERVFESQSGGGAAVE
jgi:ornithine cyclodeaminase